MSVDPGQVTELLRVAVAGDRLAAARLAPMLYSELRRLAESRMRAMAPGQTLQPTALVNEAFVRLLGKEPEQGGWENRFHFFFAASRAMHDILVEAARSKAAAKRGGDRRRVNLDGLSVATESDPESLLALSDVLARLEAEDPRKHQMVMLRFFAGLTVAEAAEVMGVPVRTFERQWRFARAWLHRELSGEGGPAREGDADA
jgi:RNA polymerase sigma factor (TIGR02999 family)